MSETITIKVRVSSDGMGEGATYNDAIAYADFVELRLREIHPDANVTVTLAPEGEDTSAVVWDDTSSMHDVLPGLWVEFCESPELWAGSDD